MTSYKISELNFSSGLQPTNLTVVVGSGVTKKVELSGVWEACLDGSLNSNNTAVFKQNLQINENLKVNGDTTLGNTPSDFTFINGTLNVLDNAVIEGNLNVDGDATLGNSSSDSIEINGVLRAKNNLNVDGDTTLGNSSSDITIINGVLNPKNDIIVEGSTTLGNSPSDTTTVKGNLYAQSDLGVDGSLSVNGNLNVDGDATLGNSSSDIVNVNGNLKLFNLSTGSSNTVITKDIFNNLQTRNINPAIWNTGVIFLTSSSPLDVENYLNSLSANDNLFSSQINSLSASNNSFLSQINSLSASNNSFLSQINSLSANSGSLTNGLSVIGNSYINGNLNITNGLSVSGNTVLGQQCSNSTTINGSLILPCPNGDITTAGNITANSSKIPVTVVTVTNNKTFSDSDTNQIFHFNTSSPLSAIFPNTLSNGFNVAVMNTGTSSLHISTSSNYKATGNTLTEQYTGAYIYKANSEIFAVGGF